MSQPPDEMNPPIDAECDSESTEEVLELEMHDFQTEEDSIKDIQLIHRISGFLSPVLFKTTDYTHFSMVKYWTEQKKKSPPNNQSSTPLFFVDLSVENTKEYNRGIYYNAREEHTKFMEVYQYAYDSTRFTAQTKWHASFAQVGPNSVGLQRLGTVPSASNLMVWYRGMHTYVVSLVPLETLFKGYGKNQIDYAIEQLKKQASCPNVDTQELTKVAARLAMNDGFSRVPDSRVFPQELFSQLLERLQQAKYVPTLLKPKASTTTANNVKNAIELAQGIITCEKDLMHVPDAQRVDIDQQQVQPKRDQLITLVAAVIRNDRTQPSEQEKQFNAVNAVCTGISLWESDMKGKSYFLSFTAEAPTVATAAIDPGKIAIARQRLLTIGQNVNRLVFILGSDRGSSTELVVKALCTKSCFANFLATGDIILSPESVLAVIPTLNLGSEDLTYNSNQAISKNSYYALLMLAVAAYYDPACGTSCASEFLSIGKWLGQTQSNCTTLARDKSGSRRNQRNVALRFFALHSKSKWDAEKTSFVAYVQRFFPDSTVGINTALDEMGITVRAADRPEVNQIDMRYWCDPGVQATVTDGLKWQWLAYKELCPNAAIEGFVQTLMHKKFGESMVQATLAWHSMASLRIKLEGHKNEEERKLPTGCSTTTKTLANGLEHILFGTPQRDLLEYFQAIMEHEFPWNHTTGKYIQDQSLLEMAACSRGWYEIGIWRLNNWLGMRPNNTERVHVLTQAEFDARQPHAENNGLELRRGLFFIYTPSADGKDRFRCVKLIYLCSKMNSKKKAAEHYTRDQDGRKVQNEWQVSMDGPHGKVWGTNGQSLGRGNKIEMFQFWLPQFLDAYFKTVGTEERRYTTSIRDIKHPNMFKELTAHTFPTAPGSWSSRWFLLYKQDINQQRFKHFRDFTEFMRKKASYKNAPQKPTDEIRAKFAAKGVRLVLNPPAPHKNDETDSTKGGQIKTPSWLDGMMADHALQLSQGKLTFGEINARGSGNKKLSYQFQRFTPQPRKKGRKRQKVEALTSHSSYEFKMVGMQLLPHWSPNRKMSLQCTLSAVAEGIVRPSFAFNGRQHNISILEGLVELMSCAMGISRSSEICGMLKENEIQQTLDKEQHHSERIIHAHYVKLLALPLCSPTKNTRFLLQRLHSHPTPIRISLEKGIEMWPETLVHTKTHVDTSTDVWTRIDNFEHLTIQEQVHSLYLFSICKKQIEWIVQWQDELKDKNGSVRLFEWFENVKNGKF